MSAEQLRAAASAGGERRAKPFSRFCGAEEALFVPPSSVTLPVNYRGVAKDNKENLLNAHFQ